MSFMDSLKRAASQVGRQVARDVRRRTTKEIRRRTGINLDTRRSGTTRRSHTDARPTHTHRDHSDEAIHQTNRTPSSAPHPEFPGPDERAIEYDIEQLGLPDFEYEPERNGLPDPGEVVWTWVPYDENDGRGKDRPVLVMADTEDHVIFGQMTSKDHSRNADWEAQWGRHWMDVGTGEWDHRGRPSEVRLDRLLVAHVDQIRREGSFLRKDIYDDVVAALKNLHG